jgi:hypothetical protein
MCNTRRRASRFTGCAAGRFGSCFVNWFAGSFVNWFAGREAVRKQCLGAGAGVRRVESGRDERPGSLDRPIL